jgi:predicted AlkP superfamily pyrophosphatase or phosphodiesterase
MKVQFIGPRFPTLTLLGTSAYSVFSHIQEVIHEEKTFEILRKPEGDTLLNNAALNGHSLFFTTNVLDDGIHKTGKQDPKNSEIVEELEDVIIKLKNFIDGHPDYLFVFVSDHGGSQTGGQHEGQLHGIPDNGNEAWVLFYNPSLTPLMTQGSWLDTVDVASTIAKYFKGVNIPMESVGKVAPNNDNMDHSYKVYIKILL